VYARRLLRLPVMVQGGAGLIGKELTSDVFVEGVDPALFKNLPKDALTVRPGEPMPVVVNDQLLGMFNASVAEAVGAPKLAGEAVTGFEFELVLGRSYLMGANGAKRTATVRARVVGFSPQAMRLGMSIPLPIVDQIEREYRNEQAPPVYTAAVVEVT